MKNLIVVLIMLITSLATPVAAEQSINKTVYADVNGLVCDFCARALEKMFQKQEAVKNIDVNLDNKVITINFKKGQTLDNETITQIITDAGYHVETLRHGNEGNNE